MGRIETKFKQTEAGLIPEDWEVKKLVESIKIITPRKKIPLSQYLPIGSIPVIDQSKSIISGYTNDLQALIKQNLPLIIFGDHTCIIKIIFFQFAQGADGVKVFYGEEEIITPYLFYSLLLNPIKIEDYKRHFLKLKNKIVSFPPTKTEQTAIANALSDADGYIESLEKLIDKKQKIKQGAMQQLLKPKPHWVLNRLGDVVKIKKGELITNNTRVDGNIPVIAGGRSFAYHNNKANRFGKTITISASGASAGYIAFHNYPIFASDCSTIEEDKNYSIEFIFFFLQLLQEKIYKMQTGGAQPHIHPSDLNPIEIIIPNKKSEQEEIAKILSDMDSEISTLTKKLTKAKAIKQGMMQQLLTGKIRLV